MQTILITGANRGIGLELTRQYMGQGTAFIFAACRAPENAESLQALASANPARLAIVQLDITDAASIERARQAVAAKAGSLDLLINNAGIAGTPSARRLGQLTAAEVSRVIDTNAVSPLLLTQAFRPLLQASAAARVVMISSGNGSLTNARGNSYAYRMSKAAMNMAARVLALDAAMAGITTVTVNPGWVKTDMGGPDAALEPAESASALLALFARLSAADNGKFFQYDGSSLPW